MTHPTTVAHRYVPAASQGAICRLCAQPKGTTHLKPKALGPGVSKRLRYLGHKQYTPAGLETKDRVYHWKHDWIPLDHAAALSKAKGNESNARKYTAVPKEASAPSAQGVSHKLLTYTSQGGDNLDFTKVETVALADYQVTAYHEVNESLRGQRKNTPRTQAKIRALDSALSRSALPNDLTVYRGIQDRPAGLGVGAEFHDPGFTSTTLDAGHAAGIFADAEVMRDVPQGTPDQHVEAIVMHLRIPKGTHALRLDSKDAYMAREKEVLLARGSTFRVVREQAGIPGKTATVLWAELTGANA